VRIRTTIALAALALTLAGCSTDDSARHTSSSPATTTAKQGPTFRLIAPEGLASILARERRARRRDESSTTSTSTTTTTTLAPATAPFTVGTLSQTFVDPTRATPARGGSPQAAGRTLVTTIYYPTPATAPNSPPVVGPFPLLVFAHGYAIDAAAYAPLLHDLAAGGYVVAAPDFPGTSTTHPSGAVRSDSLEEPADISFVITSMIELSGQPGPLAGLVDPNAIGDAGQSDGGVVAAAAAFNTCCIDPRIKASSILTGGSFGFDGQWFPPGTPPVMFVHATADEVNPYSASTSMFAQARSPKHLFTIDGGSHLEVYVDPPWEDQVAIAMVAFFDLYLKGDPTATDRLAAAGSVPGYGLESG
jgi:alpha-beta hydrolase superfamily lysophospholipase